VVVIAYSTFLALGFGMLFNSIIVSMVREGGREGENME